MRGKATTEGFGAVRAMLKEFDTIQKDSVHSLDVGVIRTATYQPEKEGASAPTVAQVAAWNEFGTRGGKSGGGWGGPVPARPFMWNTILEGRKDSRIKQVVDEGITPESPAFDYITASRLAEALRMVMLEQMKSPSLAPNAPFTIAWKGSSKPLHGKQALLVNSIHTRVNKDEPQDDDEGVILI